jgi:hypothetical protein
MYLARTWVLRESRFATLFPSPGVVEEVTNLFGDEPLPQQPRQRLLSFLFSLIRVTYISEVN